MLQPETNCPVILFGVTNVTVSFPGLVPSSFPGTVLQQFEMLVCTTTCSPSGRQIGFDMCQGNSSKLFLSTRPVKVVVPCRGV